MQLPLVRSYPSPAGPVTRTKAVAGSVEADTSASPEPSRDSRDPVIRYRVLGPANDVPAIPGDTPVPSGPVRDVVVVGGGLSGLSALWKLGDKNAVLLERMDTTGGLAQEGHREGVTYAEGAAYFTEPEGELLDLYREIGLGAPSEVEIKTPVDSYLADGQLVKDVWDQGLDKLPEEFRKFKAFLQLLDSKGMIGHTPFEAEPEKVRQLDLISAAQLIRPFGPRVKEFLDLYCRSALGKTSDNVSAMAFLNFYIDEIGPRFAFPGGTAGVADQLEKKIREQRPDAIQAGATVYDVHHRPDGLVEVRYNQDGKNHAVLSKEVVMAVPLSAAANLIKDLPNDRKQLFDSIEHCHYLVHNVFTPRPIYDKSYDTWVKGASFTDVIVGRWQETKGYSVAGSRNGEGILTVYQPLPEQYSNRPLNDPEVRDLAAHTVSELEKLFPQMKRQDWIDVESFRWAQAMHITKPGQITEEGADLKKPFGHILFAGNDLGVPSFEEALYRGMDAARSAEKACAGS